MVSGGRSAWLRLREGPEWNRTAEDRGNWKRTEIAAVEGIGGLPVHKEDLAFRNRAAALPNGQRPVAMITFASRGHHDAIDHDGETGTADCLSGKGKDVLQEQHFAGQIFALGKSARCANACYLCTCRFSLGLWGFAHLAGGRAMRQDDDLRIRPGRIRKARSPRSKPFIAQALAAAERAGSMLRRSSASTPKGAFGRGRAAGLVAMCGMTNRSRVAVIKARVVRHGAKRAPLSAHLAYLRRDGVTKDGEPARMFGAESDDVDHKAFAEQCDDDRHHFRFIVAPDDAAELSDMKAFTRDLLADAERDLGTRLEWIAVDHWNTEPSAHSCDRPGPDHWQEWPARVGWVVPAIGIWSPRWIRGRERRRAPAS
jgi:hypothetical protein